MTQERAFRGRAVKRGAALALAVFMLAGTILAAHPAPAMAQKAKAKRAGKTDVTAALRTRVRQLEEQLLDMQVVIGTLQSLARSGGGSRKSGSSFSGPAGGAGARVSGLETQVQALTAQVQRLAEQMRGRRGDAGGIGPRVPNRNYAGNSAGETDNFRPSAVPYTPAPMAGNTGAVSGFGTTTVTPGADSIGQYLTEDKKSVGAGSRRLASTGRNSAGGGGSPKQLYESAYGYLLQQNYGAAQTAFKEFLELYPKDGLASNAQYWLGETYYVRRQYRSAASAFLKGYETYGRSNKASDSLLKLAMSFDRLGQKAAACSSFKELSEVFPRAPSHVKNRAQSERRRAGC